MKLSFLLTTLTLALSLTSAVSAQAMNQVLENCESENKLVTLKIEIKNNDFLQAQLIDSTSARGLPQTFTDKVVATNSGFSGRKMRVTLNLFRGQSFATVSVLSRNPRAEPRVYPNLKCALNVK